MVFTAARAVVPDDFGKLVCRLVLVVAAEARAAAAKNERMLEGMAIEQSSQQCQTVDFYQELMHVKRRTFC